jgi:hypothetical protein
MMKAGDVIDTLKRALTASGEAAARVAHKRWPLQFVEKSSDSCGVSASMRRHGTLRTAAISA